MAIYYGYNNVKFTINNQTILADSVSFSLASKISENLEIDRKGGFSYVTASGAEGSLSLTYFLEGLDPLKDYIGGESHIPFEAAGLSVQKGYLTSYQISSTPFGPAKVNATLSIYEDFGGSFSPSTLEDTDRVYVRFSDMDVTFQGINATDNVRSLSYSVNRALEPLYLAGEITPDNVRLSTITTNLSIETYDFTEALPYQGKNVSVDFTLGENSYKANGIMEAKDIGFLFGQKISATLAIKSNSYGGVPVLRESNTGAEKSAGDYWHIYGYNLLDTTAVYFNNNIRANEFTTLVASSNGNDSEIKVKIPRFARSGPIRVITPYGEAAHEQRTEPAPGGAPIIANIDPSDIP